MLAQVNSRKKSRKASDDFGVMALPASGPSKEYVYAGSKLISTVEPTAVNGNDAQFVSMCVHDAFSEWFRKQIDSARISLPGDKRASAR